jgi:uncharacterized membrane protein YeaQ/YmgE (transglycosylase-associated protein family)
MARCNKWFLLGRLLEALLEIVIGSAKLPSAAESATFVAMSLFDWLVLLLVAGVCGSIGQAIAGYSHGGCLASIALGFIGALIGVWLAREFKLPELFVLQWRHLRFPIVWSIIGATLFVAVVGLVSRRRV